MPRPGLNELRANLDAILKQTKAKPADNQSSGAPIKMEPIIYGADKPIGLDKFDIGAVLKAISEDLEEFGKKGVQGVRIEPNWQIFIKRHKARTDLKAPCLQAGVVKGTLVLVLRDEESNVEAMDVLVKDYAHLKEKLKKSSASVTNIEPDDVGGVISKAAERRARRLGTTVSQDSDYGEITGNIILCAHGRPATMPSGRLVADKLGRKTPQEIFQLLTSNKESKKRVGKDYNGTLTLAGCFTASGGPEAEKQDDPYAKMVLDLFRKNGYAKISVVGSPGAVITVDRADTDTHGTPLEEGDDEVRARAGTGAELDRKRELEGAATEAIETYNDLVDEYNAAAEDLKESGQAVHTAMKNSGMSEADYLKTPECKAGLEKHRALEATLNKLDQEADAAHDEMKKVQKALKDSGLQDTWARLEGRFGLRTIN